MIVYIIAFLSIAITVFVAWYMYNLFDAAHKELDDDLRPELDIFCHKYLRLGGQTSYTYYVKNDEVMVTTIILSSIRPKLKKVSLKYKNGKFILVFDFNPKRFSQEEVLEFSTGIQFYQGNYKNLCIDFEVTDDFKNKLFEYAMVN